MMKKDVIKSHAGGKVEMSPKVPINSYDDFSLWYTPGVAEACKAIEKKKERVYELTNRWNSVAIMSDGTRVLGLGDIGAEAGLPVMEGKALLFKCLGGVDAIPICLGTKRAEDIISVCKWLEPSFGGINLEDIESPKCFYILEAASKKLEIPVFHDDQQGTAVVVLAALKNALKVAGKKLDEMVVAQIGFGAAGSACAKLYMKAGVKNKNVRVVDLVNGKPMILTEDQKGLFPYRSSLLKGTNGDNVKGGTAEALEGADAVIAFTAPKSIKKEWVKRMAGDPIVFAMANPVPEIMPDEAKESGARIAATGRSDFPNQVNNSLGFPAIFRGALDVRARTISEEMCIAAADAIAGVAEEKGISEEYIVPRMDDPVLYKKEATAVGAKAMEQGIAKVSLSKKELAERVEFTIDRAQLKLLSDYR